jgi:excisionase family DNA binding protein
MRVDVLAQNQSVAGNNKLQASLDAETLLTVQEVAGLLKVPVSWVYEHTRQECADPLPAVKVGKYLRFFRKDILDHLEAIRLKNHRHR